MNGWGTIASPPCSWIASTVSSIDIPRLIGFSRNQPRMCVCAGAFVVTSWPATTVRPDSWPRAWASRTESMVSWSVTAMRSSFALFAASTSCAGVTMPSEESVWQWGSARICRLGEDRMDEGGWIEGCQVGDPLPHAGELDRDVELGLDPDHRPAFGAAVELGQREPGHRDRLVELARLDQVGEPKHRVEHQQRFIRSALERLVRHASDLGALLEQIALGLQTAGGVSDDDVVAAAPRRVDAIKDHGC